MNDSSSISGYDRAAYQAMVDNGFEPAFSAAALDQTAQIAGDPPAIDLTRSRDLRSLAWSSIDNRRSRDLDQAEFAERTANGDIRLLVAIADVDAAVAKGTPLDRRAAINTVTVYTESKIFPMLPEVLSTDLTSLNASVDRNAIIAEMLVNQNGDVPESTFYRAAIRNRAKLAYEDVGSWLEGNGSIPDTPEIAEQLKLQQETADRLYAYRQKKGALEFESVESQAVIENGEVKKIVSVMPNAARRLIENFMIAANVEMAEFLERSGSASLRRVVEKPKRWDGIVRIASEYGTKLPPEPDQPALAAFLDSRRRADAEQFPDLSLSIIKLIGSGRYVVQRRGEEAGGHFGLAVADYSHSTAPNRRFTDIVIQRLVKAVIDGAREPYTPEELDAIALRANMQERAARKVERKMRKIIAAGVMQRRIGERFTAIVTGVNASGTFARILRPPVDGRIVRGERGLEVGQKIEVTLLAANPRNGFIDFAAG